MAIQNQERFEVYREHLDECFRHFARRLLQKAPRGSKDSTKSRKPIVDFCEVCDTTVVDWVNAESLMPTGENRIKLMCFLDLNAYRVIELERMEQPFRGFLELLGYKLLTMEQAVTMLQYADSKGVFRLLKSEGTENPEKKQLMWDAWKTHKDELERRKRECEKRFLVKFPFERKQKDGQKLCQEPSGNLQSAAFAIMQGLLIMFEEGMFEHIPPDQLDAIRMSHGRTIVGLSSQLSRFSANLMVSETMFGGE